MRYVYSAIFTPDTELKDYYVVEFPDIDVAVTQGKNFPDACRMAEDILNLVLMTMEDDGEKIPKPTELITIKVEDDKLVSLIEADTDAYRKNFIEKLACHEIWYSPIVERKFFVLKNDEEEICRRLARLLEKIAGVKLFDKFN